jgi:predicted NBD/HSP70 family sugar kinase
MVTGDGAYIKRINRSIILEKIIEHGMISRADLSKITGLNKATISVQVADLLEEELIQETQLEHYNVGRRPIMLSINSKAAYVLGIDLDYEQIHYTVADLQGHAVVRHTEKIQIVDYDEIVQLLAKQIKKYQKKFNESRYGLVSVMIGVHGTVNRDESIYFNPKYRWHNKILKADLMKKIDVDVYIENNANLSAYAETVYHYHNSNNLVNVILTSGIGAGIMSDGEIQRGYHGYAGEMGHMIVSFGGLPCSCGNKGCWEQYASEPSIMNHLSAKLNNPNLTRDEVLRLLQQDNQAAIEQVEESIPYISAGLNNVINLYNPETIVINSSILSNIPNAVKKLESHLNSSVSQYSQIVLSDLGDQACVNGACALAIQRFFNVQRLNLTRTNRPILQTI